MKNIPAIERSEFIERREFLKWSGVASAMALTGCASQPSAPQKLGRVIIVGGGYGGATAAKYLRMWSEGAIEVFLIDRSPAFISCPLSNLVLGGSRKIEDITVGYAKLRDYGVQVINDEVTKVNVDKKTTRSRAWRRLRRSKTSCTRGRLARKPSPCAASSKT